MGGATVHLLAAVEDGAIAGGAEHVLVQGALTPLALRPQRRELALQLIHIRQGPLVKLRLLQPPSGFRAEHMRVYVTLEGPYLPLLPLARIPLTWTIMGVLDGYYEFTQLVGLDYERAWGLQ